MSLSAGARLGPYEIVGPLGAGGMGEVYKARDARLDRIVAIKVLPEHLAQNPEARQRFEREARAVSSLNHPNICTLHDIGHQGGVDYLVMEYLEGETLADRLAKGPLPIDEVLRHAIPIADALAQAHRQSVFHRDLKPGNIMLTRTGAKLLDFGLAKSAAAAVSGATESRTLTRALTAEGTILGTIQYMSPEQLEGRNADARSDIFALGAVLYEMATGRKAFPGSSQASVIGAILHVDPPPVSAAVNLAPPAFDRVVKTCLAKNPDDRWQTARDLKREIEWIGEAAPAPILGAPSSRVRFLPWVVAGLCLLAAVAAISLWPRAETPAAVRFVVFPPENSTFNFTSPTGGPVALSPDGRRLAFVATTPGSGDQIWVRRLETLASQPLSGTSGAYHPFWSEDGSRLAFFAGGKLKVVDASGGPGQTLCDAPNGRGGTWSREGVILFTPNSFGPIYRVSSAGGPATPATKLAEARRGLTQRWPQFLPDGRHFLYLEGSFGPGAMAASNEIRLASLDSQEGKVLLRANSNATYAAGRDGKAGYLLFVRENTLMAAPFAANRLQITGEAFPLAEEIDHSPNSGKGVFSVSDNGVLAYHARPGSGLSRLAWFDRAGKRLEDATLGSPAPYGGAIALSPDGRRIALDLMDPAKGTRDIWIYEPSRDLKTRFTFDPADHMRPVWSPDGSRIVFSSNRKGAMDLYEKAADGTGSEQLLFASDDVKTASGWSPDGRFLAYATFSLTTQTDLWIMPLTGDRKPFPVLRTEFNEHHARFSPDGRWLVYGSNESGFSQVYVRPAPEMPAATPGGKWQISTNGGNYPLWRRDGKELFYLSNDNKLMVVAVKTGSKFEFGPPKPLFEARIPGSLLIAVTIPYAVAPDGQRFLFLTALDEPRSSPVTVVMNWTADVKR